MDILSWILLGLVAVWFVWALLRIFRKGTCSCSSKCNGCGGECHCCDKNKR